MGWFDILKMASRLTLDDMEYQLTSQQMQEWVNLVEKYKGIPRIMQQGETEVRKRALRRIISNHNLVGKSRSQAMAERQAARQRQEIDSANRAFGQEDRMRY